MALRYFFDRADECYLALSNRNLLPFHSNDPACCIPTLGTAFIIISSPLALYNIERL